MADESPLDPLGRVIKSLQEDLDSAQDLFRETARRNRVAAIVADTCRERTEIAVDQLDEEAVPSIVVLEMLDGIIAALAGRTDLDSLRVIHPEATPLAYARLQVLLDDRG